MFTPIGLIVLLVSLCVLSTLGGVRSGATGYPRLEPLRRVETPVPDSQRGMMVQGTSVQLKDRPSSTRSTMRMGRSGGIPRASTGGEGVRSTTTGNIAKGLPRNKPASLPKIGNAEDKTTPKGFEHLFSNEQEEKKKEKEKEPEQKQEQEDSIPLVVDTGFDYDSPKHGKPRSFGKTHYARHFSKGLGDSPDNTPDSHGSSDSFVSFGASGSWGSSSGLDSGGSLPEYDSDSDSEDEDKVSSLTSSMLNKGLGDTMTERERTLAMKFAAKFPSRYGPGMGKTRLSPITEVPSPMYGSETSTPGMVNYGTREGILSPDLQSS